ncbi:MAG: hypothetical protein A3F43_02055 [Gammaproteobacteria bacterium RIFCSPHIGHO2_12_FULL_42_10]|nr:MAG: hypothetical protein A3F43_02055 [Gammaproteobacteria bacterium RIFCSPHIGHO2_12_FULL_42_10]
MTRPSLVGEELCQLIRRHGGLATHCPAMAFESLIQNRVVQEHIKALGGQDWIIFNSPQAVFQSISAIRAMWPHFPKTLQIAAIGRGTEKALQDAGYTVSAVPVVRWSSEGLLQLPIFQQLVGKRIAIIQGEGGLGLLAQALPSRGATVTVVACYRRLLPERLMEPCHALLNAHQIDVAVLTSGEGVRNMKQVFGQIIQALPLIVPSERIKQLALDLGFQIIWVARNASHSAVLDALIKNRDVLCQMKVTH